MTSNSRHPVLGDGTIAELATGAARRASSAPATPGYDEARAIWNGAHDRRPALIVRCAGAADVHPRGRASPAARTSRRRARRRPQHPRLLDLSTAASSSTCRAMNGMRVDPTPRSASRRGRRHLGRVDAETQAFGLATTGGLVSTTGVAGFTLGGGIGWLMRKHGLACDNLVAADVVTADGQLAARQRRREPRPVLGAARRRRQLRRRHRRSSSSCTRSARRSPAARSFYPGERAGRGAARLARAGRRRRPTS